MSILHVFSCRITTEFVSLTFLVSDPKDCVESFFSRINFRVFTCSCIVYTVDQFISCGTCC